MRTTRREFLGTAGVLAASICLPSWARAGAAEVTVLLYHDIGDGFDDRYTISPSLFAAQMEWLHGNGYRAVGLGEVARLGAEERAVVITFDDGYASFMDYAYPLFREYGFRSTVNVIGSCTGGYLRLGSNRPMMSWDEYRFLLASGLVDVGCHTESLHAAAHRGALGVTEEALRKDLDSFNRRLREETGRTTDILAWPYGLYDERRTAVAKEAGFRYILTSREAPFPVTGDPSAIPRRNIDNLYDITSFRAGVGS
jgi:peptidoglycan/xylan/chitin deacetylase (PgdA/CDA1 family)